MKIKMLETQRISSDGFTVQRFHAAAIYEVGKDIGDTAARAAIRNGWAVAIKGEAA